MKALVLEKQLELTLREINLPTNITPDDVKIKMHTVGICGSDIHYYEHGKIGQWHVNAPMVLGHEGSGTVIEVGANEKILEVGGVFICLLAFCTKIMILLQLNREVLQALPMNCEIRF